METTQEKKVELSPAVIDALIQGITDGSQLFGSEGLFQQLKQAIMQRVLEAEMPENDSRTCASMVFDVSLFDGFMVCLSLTE